MGDVNNNVNGDMDATLKNDYEAILKKNEKLIARLTRELIVKEAHVRTLAKSDPSRAAHVQEVHATRNEIKKMEDFKEQYKSRAWSHAYSALLAPYMPEAASAPAPAVKYYRGKVFTE